MTILHCEHRYNRKLRSAAAYADEVMNSHAGRSGGGRRGKRNKPGAMKARDAENVCFRTVEAMTGEQVRHLMECDDCRKMRREVINKWAQLNLHLQHRHIPTCRSVSPDQFLRDVSDRQAVKLKQSCEELLAQHEANDVIKKHEGADYDAELFAQCFPTCR